MCNEDVITGRLLREAPVTSEAAQQFSVYSVEIIKEIVIPNLGNIMFKKVSYIFMIAGQRNSCAFRT